APRARPAAGHGQLGQRGQPSDVADLGRVRDRARRQELTATGPTARRRRSTKTASRTRPRQLRGLPAPLPTQASPRRPAGSAPTQSPHIVHNNQQDPAGHEYRLPANATVHNARRTPREQQPAGGPDLMAPDSGGGDRHREAPGDAGPRHPPATPDPTALAAGPGRPASYMRVARAVR